MNIESKNVEIFYDLIDEACMEHFYDLHMDYLEAFCKVASDILDHFDDSRLSEDAINKLMDIYQKVYNLNILNEEIRLALVLVIIKGLKHRMMGLDIVSPDTIGYLMTYIIQSIIKDDKATILDTAMGIGNLSMTILNNLENEISLVGIEKEEILANVSKAFSDYLYHEIKIYCQAFENKVFDVVDVVIGDLESIDNKYEVILERLDNIKDDGCFVYLIDNDFFGKANNGFKEALSKQATLTGLIVLPDNITKKEHVGKSILIGKKAVLNNYHMAIYKIESLEKEHINEVFKNIKSMIEQMEV